FIVSLLCLYVSAYARVTAEGFELARLTRKVEAAAKKEQALQAAIFESTAPETIARKAQAMGLIPATDVNLVPPPNPVSAHPTDAETPAASTEPNTIKREAVSTP